MTGEQDRPPSTERPPPLGAVFLSYASEDVEAAERIASALRREGVEVWFDKSELRGGDAWDRQIRKQIHNCALFIPIISVTTQGRLEGYFRREWRLAVDRTHDMADGKPFLVPVVIDDTNDRAAEVPDAFRAVQWSRVPAGETPPEFVERVSRLLAPGPQVQSSSWSPPLRSHSISRPGASRISVPLAIVLAVAILGIGYYALNRFALSRRGVNTGQLTSTLDPTVTAPSPEKSIAVLPFLDMSEKHDLAYFGDGLADEVLNELSRVPALRVIGRTSSFRFRDAAGDLREVGKTLGATYLLEGSVRSAGDQIRITAQLIDARDGSRQWSQAYDRTTGNMLQLQEEIATAIARVLQVTITANSSGQIAISPEGFDLYLRGMRDLDLGTAESARRALTELERASQLEPKFVPAIVGQASTYNLIGGNAYMPPNKAFPRAKQMIEKALAVDVRNADAYAVRALIRVNYDRDWAGAATDVAKAKELGGSRETYLPAAKIAGAKGDMAGAAEIYEAQLAIDPLNTECLTDLGWFVYPALHRFQDADAALHKAREVYPDYMRSQSYLPGMWLLLRGRIDEAAALIDTEGDESARQALRSAVAYAKGQRHDSDAAIKSAMAAPNPWAFAVARAYAYRGNRPEAVTWLNRAADDHDNLMWVIKTDPVLHSLAGDEAFREFLRRIDVPE